ncbi:YtcA family lipoprotein [Paraburkholderia ferrariae]|uniref:YtcA family lipoprotein n=1 Tax=Paraburkholderia ferrariae TaxID=386056 RepID=UPI0005A91876|nr:YtcA family lipoprotein [Paraburkholderia ferrariae]
MSSRRRRGCRVASVVVSCAALAGCSDAPSVGVLGAYFPEWMFCIAGGAALVACVHVLLSRRGRAGWLTPPAIIYPALTVLFSIALWAVVFNL